MYLCCDRSRKYQGKISVEFAKRNIGTRSTECPFDVIARRDGSSWTLSVRDPSHNHEASIHPTAHPTHRQIAPAIRQAIANYSAAGIAPRQIESTLRLENPELLLTRKDIRNTR